MAEKKINIIILPPWWRTWWAYSTYGLLIIVLLLAVYLFQKNQLATAERQRTQERELIHGKEIEKAYTELKATQAQLIQSEKMASLGELTAGIAHEIQNPLNFVNNFSEVNTELIEELEVATSSELRDANIEADIIATIKDNLEKINHHGKRAESIVKGMLQHSRKSTGVKELTDINTLADEYLRLSYHGLRAKDSSFQADFEINADANLPMINVIPQDIGRVLLNIINNAFQSTQEKNKLGIIGYKPKVTVTTNQLGSQVEIKIADNGTGIPEKNKAKIFQPFFTTKPTGQGTGLGLSLAYDIIKAHGGTITVNNYSPSGENINTNANQQTGTEFIITLPA